MAGRMLVTGGAGFVGSAVVRQALSGNRVDKLVNLDVLTYAGDLARLEACMADPRHVFVNGDLRDERNLDRIFREHHPVTVLHLAAETHVDRSLDDPSPFVEGNLIGTFRLLEAIRHYMAALDVGARARFRLVHVSTDEVFGSLGADDRPFTEESAYRPNSPYSATKAGADHLVRAWAHSFGIPAIVTTCCNNYGPWQFPEKLIPLVIAKALAGESLPIYGQGEQIRDWLHVEDHAAALLLIAERGRAGETYAIGGNAEHRNIEVVRAICASLDRLVPRPKRGSYAEQIARVADRPGHDFRYAIDAGRLRHELGWRPTRDFERGLDETVRWYLDHQRWWRDLMVHRYAGERLGLGGSRPWVGTSMERDA